MTHELDLAEANNVLGYLDDGPFASSEVIPLPGGYGNYTYRLRLKEEYQGRKTLVLKHGKPHIRGATWIKFDLERQVRDSTSSLPFQKPTLITTRRAEIRRDGVAPRPRAAAALCARDDA